MFFFLAHPAYTIYTLSQKNGTNSNRCILITTQNYLIFVIFYSHVLGKCGNYACMEITSNLVVPLARYGDLNMRQKIWGFQAAYSEPIKLQNVRARQCSKPARRDVTRDVTATVTSLTAHSSVSFIWVI